MSLLNRFGRRTERRADGTRSSNCYLSKIFTPLEIFSTPTLLNKIDESSKLLRWVPRWDGHPAGSLNFTFQSARPLDYGTTFVYCIRLHSAFLRNNFRTWQCIHNVSMIQMNITHEVVNQSQVSRLKIRTFRHENLCVLNTLQSHFPSQNDHFIKIAPTKLAIMWKFPCERSFSIWKWPISSTSPHQCSLR